VALAGNLRPDLGFCSPQTNSHGRIPSPSPPQHPEQGANNPYRLYDRSSAARSARCPAENLGPIKILPHRGRRSRQASTGPLQPMPSLGPSLVSPACQPQPGGPARPPERLANGSRSGSHPPRNCQRPAQAAAGPIRGCERAGFPGAQPRPLTFRLTSRRVIRPPASRRPRLITWPQASAPCGAKRRTNQLHHLNRMQPARRVADQPSSRAGPRRTATRGQQGKGARIRSGGL